MKNISHYKKLIFTGLLLVILFVASSFIILKINHVRKEKNESLNKMYICSMEPQIIRDKPGDCPICGMPLIEKKDFDVNYAGSRLFDPVFEKKDSIFVATVVMTGARAGDNIEISAGPDENSTIAADTSLLAERDGSLNTSTR